MNAIIKVLCFASVLGVLTSLCIAEDFGISEKSFDAKGFHTVFTFRKGILIHEVTVFAGSATGGPKRNNWVERFYADGQQVFLRAGAVRVSSMHFSGPDHVSIVHGSRRLYVGHESYNIGDDGLYHIIADPKSAFLVESVIDDPVFSSPTLDEERQKHLNQPKPHE